MLAATDTPPSLTAARRRFAGYVKVVLVANLGVILWGAYVRATGSGAGCGSHWPLCNGDVVPRAPSVETMIEYSHRVTSGIALLMVLALPIVAYRLWPRRHRVRRASVAVVVLMLVEAAVGAGLVLFELVAENASAARAMFMGVHLANTFLLLGAIVLLGHWAAGRPRPMPRATMDKTTRRLAWMAVVAVLGTILVGSSGAIASLGDTLFPAETLAEGLRADLAPSSHVLIKLRVLHPLIACAVSALLYAWSGAVRRARRSTSPRDVASRRWASWLQLLVIGQLTLGVANVVLLAPIPLQLLHLLMADAVWMALVLLAAHALALPSETTPTASASSSASTSLQSAEATA